MGESDRAKAGRETYGDIRGIDANIPNLFEGYEDPHSVKDILAELDKYFDTSVGNIRKNTATDINRTGNQVGSRLAGSGITSGALKEGALSRTTNDVRKVGAGSIDKLNEGRLSLTPGVLERGNESAFRNKSAESEGNYKQFMALLQKFGLQSGSLGGLDDTTFLDDIFAGLNTVSGFVNPVKDLLSPPKTAGGG